MIAYSIAQRRHEIGIRLALGASKSAITRMVAGEGARLIGWSLLAGAGASVFVLYLSHGSNDSIGQNLLLILLTASLLAVVALLACWLPARAAAAEDPRRLLGG